MKFFEARVSNSIGAARCGHKHTVPRHARNCLDNAAVVEFIEPDCSTTAGKNILLERGDYSHWVDGYPNSRDGYHGFFELDPGENKRAVARYRAEALPRWISWMEKSHPPSRVREILLDVERRAALADDENAN